MKIVTKLTAALFGGTCIILAANVALRVQSETTRLQADRVRDHEMIGRALAASLAAVWKSEGEESGLKSVRAVDEQFKRIRIHWRALETRDTWRIDSASIDAMRSGVPITRVVRNDGDGRTWYTYVPVDVDGMRRGAIELMENDAAELRFAQNIVRDTLMTALVLALLSALLAFAMGQWIVGTPVRSLAEKARRIAHGDFSGRILLKGKDELADVALEMNAMCDQLTSTLDQLRHADRLATVGRLASGVAHELGTPLNVVSARAQMIASGETSSDEARDYARVIHGASERMATIIRQLLQFARRKTAQKTSVDLRDVTQNTLDLVRPLAAKRDVRLELASTDVDTTIHVDAGQFQQVVTNLVMNAVQAMPRGGTINLAFMGERVCPPVDIGGAEADYLCLRVKDQGEGITPEVLPHIFEPFFTTKDVGQGTGLGLPVSYGIMRDHGGWIAVESKVAVGTTFTLFLPIRRSNQAPPSA